MPALFIFLFKVNIALVLFCLGYYLVLRHLTFYTLNRIYLVVAILFSTLYPNINLSDFANRHQQITGPVQNIILNWKAPAENFVKPLYQPNYWQWVELVFWAGVILFAARLILQLFSLYKLYRGSKPGQVNDFPVRLMREDISPFSFWRNIYINPTKLSPADLKSVLEHEQIHVNEWHTLDILLAELSTIFYWFNPGVWLMKKAVRENIEFITDRKILQKGTDTKQYQYSLVSVSLATTPNNIVNHFNMSTIKKRIIMMNSKKSSGYNLTRYVFLVPAVIALLLVFSLSKAEISKKGLHVVKSFANNIITSASLINTHPHIAIVKENVVKHSTIKVPAKTTDTLYSGKSKDGKKTFTMTGDANADSINYVINGVKSTRADIKAMDPARVYSIELLRAKDAKQLYPQLDNDREVMFVTTDDSETGKALKEKIDKTLRTGALAGAKNITIRRDEDSDIAPAAEASGVSVSTSYSSESSDDAPAIVLSGSNNISTDVVVTTNDKAPKVTTFKNLHITKVPKNTIVISGDKIGTPHGYTYNITKTDPADRAKAEVYLNKIENDDNETTINNVSNKLIIIDGKEAKKISNINPRDIESLTVLSGEGATAKYGNKAKNGAIEITTKKKK
jgi:bla regulator protein BlaR1